MVAGIGIQERMGLGRVCLVIFVSLICFCLLMPGGSSASRQKAEGLISTTRDPAETYDDMVEQLRIICRLEPWGIMLIKNSIKEDIVTDSTEVNKKLLLTKDNILKAIAMMPPQMKQTFLHCLANQNFPFHDLGDEDGRNWYSDYLEYLLGWHTTSRRHLADQSAAPAPMPALAPAPAPASAAGLAPTPRTIFDPPSYSPTPSPHLAPSSSSYPSGYSPSDSPKHFFPLNVVVESPSRSPSGDPIISSGEHKGNKTSMILALVLTGTGSFLFAALLCYCCPRCCGNKHASANSLRDDRPLLALSLSEFSIGSSQKSFGLGNSINTEKIGMPSFKTDPSQNGRVSSLDISSAETPPSILVSRTLSSFVDPPAVHSINPAPKPPPPPPAVPPPPPSVKKAAPPPPVPPPGPPPGPPPLPPNLKPGARPPPPPKGAFPPRPPQASSSSGKVIPPLGPNRSGSQETGAFDGNAPKTKLKPLFWDKVLASPDQSMVWHQIKSGSFQFNEEMIESLFGYSADKQKNMGKKETSTSDPSPQCIQILDPKKSQNLAILLRALNVTLEEVRDALVEGNELPTDLLQTLLKMVPTTDEELKLRLYAGEPSQLGPAERFLKALVDIPFAFKRLDALLFMSSLPEDISCIKGSFTTLEVACKELRSSRLFLKLLEAVLKTGNRMNDGTYRGGAQAFKLDTLLKLADVKGADGKITLLHFVVQEIIRSEGIRAARMVKQSGSISSINSEDIIDDSPHESGDHYRSLGLKVVSGLGNELENVKKAAILDADALTSMVGNLGKGLFKITEFLNKDMRSTEEDSGFHLSLKGFVEHAEIDINFLLEEEKRIKSLVKSTTDYFHGSAGKDEGLRLFVIVHEFLGMLDKACQEVVRELQKRVPKTPMNKDAPGTPHVPGHQLRLFPAVMQRRADSSSSDDGSP